MPILLRASAGPSTDSSPDPADRAAFHERLDRVAEEKRQALADPGPSWREWALYEGAKWWIVILFLIVDSWIVAGYFQSPDLPLFVVEIAVAVYLEFLLYRVLWTRLPIGRPRSRGPFRRTPWRPVECGRWTPEAAMRRSGALRREEGPQPKDFL